MLAALALRKVLTGTTLLIAKQSTISLLHRPAYSMAFMALFEKNKTPAELSPVFKHNTKQKGHLQHRTVKFHSVKRNKHVRKQPMKLKNHKGLLKRVKIAGPRWNRQFKVLSSHNYHLKRNKSRANLKRKSLNRYVHKADIWRVRKLIPYFKRRSLKQRY